MIFLVRAFKILDKTKCVVIMLFKFEYVNKAEFCKVETFLIEFMLKVTAFFPKDYR